MAPKLGERRVEVKCEPEPEPVILGSYHSSSTYWLWVPGQSLLGTIMVPISLGKVRIK